MTHAIAAASSALVRRWDANRPRVLPEGHGIAGRDNVSVASARMHVPANEDEGMVSGSEERRSTDSRGAANRVLCLGKQSQTVASDWSSQIDMPARQDKLTATSAPD